MGFSLLTFTQYLIENEDEKPKKHPWDKNPKIGWWKDHETVTMYHGTHEKNLAGIKKHGLKAPEHGPTAHKVSLTHDPHTAHGYASMTGGESAFRGAKDKAQTVPHHHRATLIIKAPRHWVEKHHDKTLGGNMDRSKLADKSTYEKHKAKGGHDHEHYQATELRFHHIPPEYIHGYMKKREHE